MPKYTLNDCAAQPLLFAAQVPLFESSRGLLRGAIAISMHELRNVNPDHHHWVEMKLIGGPKSPRDAVGYVDGYMIIVEGGRQHLGKRRKVRVTEIARTGAHATVLKKDAN